MTRGPGWTGKLVGTAGTLVCRRQGEDEIYKLHDTTHITTSTHDEKCKRDARKKKMQNDFWYHPHIL